MPFCITASTPATAQKTSTCMPPRRTSSQRAFSPMHVKKATRNGVFTFLLGALNQSTSAVTSHVHQRAVTLFWKCTANAPLRWPSSTSSETQQSADDRGGNIEARQQPDAPDEHLAQQQHRNGQQHHKEGGDRSWLFHLTTIQGDPRAVKPGAD